MARRGVEALTDGELLAILLRTGMTGHPVGALSAALVKKYDGQGGRKKISEVTLEDWAREPGVGPAKAAGLVAAFELARRQFDHDGTTRPTIQGPRDVLAQVQDIRSRKKEHFLALYLNTRNQVLHREFVSIGTVNASLVHPREVFEPALRVGAIAIILAHNHPSGDPQPSDEDVALTRRLAQAGTLLGIDILDHIVVTAEGYLSLRDARLL